MSIADVRGKAALVVGGTQGIGRAIVERFAESYRQPVTGAALDVTDRAQIREVVKRFAVQREEADILVYNAGVSPVYASAEKVDEED